MKICISLPGWDWLWCLLWLLLLFFTSAAAAGFGEAAGGELGEFWRSWRKKTR